MQEIFIPGRVCLFGEHSDWAAVRHNQSSQRASGDKEAVGMAIAVGTNQGHRVRFTMSSRPVDADCGRAGLPLLDIEFSTCLSNSTLEFRNLVVNGNERRSWTEHLEERFHQRDQPGGGEEDFLKYVYGAMRQMLGQFQDAIVAQLVLPKGGEDEMDGEQNIVPMRHVFFIDNYASDLPVAKGLSSSAAICVAIVRCFNLQFALGLSVDQEIDIAYRSERSIGSSCGKLDQPCPAYGPGRPLLLEFRGEQDVIVKPLMIAGTREPLYFIVVDLMAAKDTVRILADLNAAFDSVNEKGVHQEVATMRANARKYLLEENIKIVQQAIEYIKTGDAHGLGELMTNAQRQFDQYLALLCPSELTAPLLHRVLGYGPIQHLITGGKGHGSGGDGTALLLCPCDQSRQQAMTILESDLNVKCLPLDL